MIELPTLTDAELDDLYERSKLDHEIIVGSEVRQLIGEIRRHRSLFELRLAAEQMAVAQWCIAHPDSELPIPERGDLIIWLLDQLDGFNRVERTDAGLIDWKMEAQRANRLLDGWERVGRVDAALAKRVGDHIARDSQIKARLTEWLRCYATDIFPEPDLTKAAEVLRANGMTIDSLSAEMGRHVLTKVLEMLDATEDDEGSPHLHTAG
jgi:hypothetical protein